MAIRLKPAQVARWVQALVESSTELVAPIEPLDSAEELVEWAQQKSVDESSVWKAFAQAMDFPWKDQLNGFRPCPHFVTRYPISLARQNHVLAGEVTEQAAPVAHW